MQKISKYTIDPVLFQKSFSKSCGPFKCESVCCSSGVFADVKEKEVILSHKESIKKYMDETQTTDDTQWFEQHIEEDQDFPSGKAIGTNVHNNKCVFLRKDGMCSIQVMSTEQGMGKWAIKPFYCIAFPITVVDGVLTFDDYQDGKTQCCSLQSTKDSHEQPLVDSCKEELEYILGKEGYQSLMENYQSEIRK